MKSAANEVTPTSGGGPLDESDAGPTEPPAVDSSEANKPDKPERQILYRLTGKGLVVEIDGMRFEPVAKPVRYRGGWAVEISVSATATDERTHSLLTPENGPLTFYAEVQKGGNIETFGDQRDGEDDTFVTPGDTTELSRQFPSKGSPPMWGGQSLTLQVGLWGLGAEDSERRPVKKLFLVKMVTGNKTPQPIIAAPE